MEFVRIGDKVVSKAKISKAVERILELRSAGLSQQEVANQLGLDRTLVSKLESIGEVRKGGKVALIGFPVGNKGELQAVAEEEGVDFVLLMTNRERWDWVREKSGTVLIDDLMELISRARDCDSVIFIGSDMRIRLAEAVLGQKVIGIEIGSSPIQADKHVDPEAIRSLIRGLKV